MKFYNKVISFYMGVTHSTREYSANRSKSSIHISGKSTKKMWCSYLLFSAFIIALGVIRLFPEDGDSGDLIYYLVLCFVSPAILLTIMGVGVIISFITVAIKSKFIFSKLEKKATNINIYQRELPTKLKPLHVRMLLNDGLIDEMSLACTILDLIDRGYLTIKRKDNGEYSKLDIFKKGDIILCKTDKSTDDLLSFEKYIIEWFIDRCGNGKEVSSVQLSIAIYGSNSLELGSESFDEFKGHAMLSFPIRVFYSEKEQKASKYIKYCIFIFFSLCAAVPVISTVLGVYSIGMIMFAMPNWFLNQTGVDEKDSWEDLKKYLIDFGDIKSKTPEMLAIWDFYITYSVALGIKGVAGEEIKQFFGDSIYLVDMNQLNKPEHTSEETSEVDRNFLSKSQYLSIMEEIKKEIDLLAEEEKKKYDYYKF